MSLVLILVVGIAAILLIVRRRETPPDPRRQLASVATHLARGARQGMTPSDALAEAASRAQGVVGEQLTEVHGRIRRGLSFDDALREWSDRVSSAGVLRGAPNGADVQLLAVAVRFAERHGSGLAEVFESVATALLDRAEIGDELGALTSQARASVAVLCALPVLGLILVTSIQPEVPGVLLRTPTGLTALVAAVLLDVGAVVISARLTARAIR